MQVDRRTDAQDLEYEKMMKKIETVERIRNICMTMDKANSEMRKPAR